MIYLSIDRSKSFVALGGLCAVHWFDNTHQLLHCQVRMILQSGFVTWLNHIGTQTSHNPPTYGDKKLTCLPFHLLPHTHGTGVFSVISILHVHCVI